jgi:outer membrane protein assembly factor BamB
MTRRTLAVALALTALATGAARGDDWPQWMGPQRDDIWRETGILDKFPDGGPKVLWRAPIAGGYAGPAVAGGKVYLPDFVRTSPAGSVPTGKERLLCLDAATGKEVWKHEYDCSYKGADPNYAFGPRCTPTVDGGKVYALGAAGHLVCLDTAKGTPAWSHELQKDYLTKLPAPFWGFCGHPLVDGRKLICVAGGEGSVAVAFDKDTGKELWRALSANNPGYCPPTIIEAGGKRQLVIWHAEAVNGLDPETGSVYWSVPLKPMYGMAIGAPRPHGDLLFASSNGVSALIKLATDKPGAEVVWKGDGTRSFTTINMTAFIDGSTVYGVDQPGQMRGVNLEDGKRLWETFQPVAGKRAPCGTAFIVKNGDRYFLFNELGDLIIARLSPQGYEEVSRAHLLDRTSVAFGRDVLWSHPAFANKCVFVRNDKELICVSLAK